MGYIRTKISDGCYYEGPDNEAEDFSNEKFNNYVARGEYRQAAEYANRYSFENVIDQNKYDAYVNELYNRADKMEALYTRAKTMPGGQKYYDAMRFTDALQAPDVMNTLGEESNTYYNRYKQLTDVIGNYIRPAARNNVENNRSASLKISFNGNRNNGAISYSDFLQLSNLTEEDLLANDVQIHKNDDNTAYITFNKSNRLANHIYYGIGKTVPTGIGAIFSSNGNLPVIEAFDEKGNEVGNTKSFTRSFIDGFKNLLNHTPHDKIPNLRSSLNAADDDQDRIDRYNSARWYNSMAQFASLVDDAKALNNAYYETGGDNPEMQVNSTLLFGYFDDNLEKNRQKVINGEMQTTAFNQLKEGITLAVENELAGFNSSDYEFYSDFDSRMDLEEDTNLLKITDPREKNKLTNSIKNALAENKLTYQIANNNGRFGLYLTIPPKTKTVSGNHTIEEAAVTVFIPDLCADQINRKVNTDTEFMAMRTVDDMKHYGFTYHSRTGWDFKIDNSTGYPRYLAYEGDRTPVEFESEDEMIRFMNRENVKLSITKNFASMYVNNNGELVNYDDMVQRAKVVARNAGNNLYKKEIMSGLMAPITDTGIFGDVVVNENELGNVSEKTDSLALLNDKNLNAYEENRLYDIYSIFDYIMKYMFRFTKENEYLSISKN